MRHAANVSIVIHRAPAEVFAVLTDFGNWPQWGGGNLLMYRLLLKQFLAGDLRKFKALVEAS